MNNYFIKQEKIRFLHIDFAGIVFYPRFLEMLNSLVEDWFEEALDVSFATLHQTHGIPTVDLKVQFKKPARLGEVLSKKLWVHQINNSSMVCNFIFENEAKEICLQGEVTLVNVIIENDRATIKSAPFTAEMRAKITDYLIPNL